MIKTFCDACGEEYEEKINQEIRINNVVYLWHYHVLKELKDKNICKSCLIKALEGE